MSSQPTITYVGEVIAGPIVPSELALANKLYAIFGVHATLDAEVTDDGLVEVKFNYEREGLNAINLASHMIEQGMFDPTYSYVMLLPPDQKNQPHRTRILIDKI